MSITYSRSTIRTSAFAASLMFFGWAAGTTTVDAQETLVLAVDNATAEPGKLAAVILRTYQPRPVSQGQVSFIIGEPRFTGIRRAAVMSAQRDATFSATFTPGTDAMVTMQLPTASINELEGPVILIAFRVDPTATPGDTFPISVQLPDSFLFDQSGSPIAIDTMPGTFTVKAPGAPFELEADNAKGPAGVPVTLFVKTVEWRPLESGQIDYRYDPAVLTSIDSVRVNAVSDDVSYTADTSMPGRILVTFTSPGRVNRIPGPMIQIGAQVAPGLPDGFTSPLTIEPSTTSLTARDGKPLVLFLDQGRFEVKN